MSLFSKIKKTLTDVFTQDDEDDKKKESKNNLASKTLTTGTQTTKAKSKANTAALKSTQNSQQVKATSAIKQPKEKGTTATKINSSAFSGNKSTTSQNRYNNLKIKNGGGLYTESDFGNMRANSVRMSDSQKGNNNSKPTGIASVIKMANIQSKNLDNTVQNTINAYNAAAQKSTTGQNGHGTFKIKNNGGLYTEDDFKNLRANSVGADNLQKGNSSVISGVTKNALSKLPTNKDGTPTEDAKKAILKMAAKNATNDVGGVFKGIADAIASPAESIAETSKNAYNKAVKQSTHEINKPRTLASVDGKAPAGAKVGDTIVTNAGSYKITGVYSDGSFKTDSKDTWTDSQGKVWESPTKKGKKQTKSNTYDYDDPNKVEKEATFSTGEFTKNLVSNFLNDDSKKEEYEANVHNVIKDAEMGYNSLSASTRKDYTNKDYGLLGYVDTNETDTEVALADTMSTEQKGIYNYLYEKKGRKAAKEYYEAIKYTELEPKQAEKLRGYVLVDAESNPIVSSIASVGANTVLPIINTVRNTVQGTKNALGIGKYKPITADDNFSVISNYGSEVRKNVSKEISNPALRIGYNAVMSIADMAAQTAVAGAGGTAANAGKFVTLSMSTVSANDTILDTLSRGGSQKQAFANGLVNGALEYISESPAVEGLFAVGRGIRPITNVKDLSKTVLRQMGVEGGGEGFANITQTLADQIIMGKKSTFGETVSEYMSNQNMLYNDAVKQATIDLYGKGTAEAVITGALAGGVLGGGSTAVNVVSTGRNINSNTDYAKDLANTADEIGVTGSAAKTVQAIKNGEKVSAVNAANLKGTVQKYYLDEATNDIDNIYEYVELEAPNRLSLAFGKTSSKDETGFQNKKFTDAWLNKSLDILDKINQYRINSKPELKREISDYLDYSNTLLYSGVLSQEGQVSAGVRAQANQVVNGIAASAAGENIVSEDSNLYEEDTVNTSTDTNQDTLDTNQDTLDTNQDTLDTNQKQGVNTIQDDLNTASVMGDIVDAEGINQGNNQNTNSDDSSNPNTANATSNTDSDTLDNTSDTADVNSDAVELQSSDINPVATSGDNTIIDNDTTGGSTADTGIKKTTEIPTNSVVKRDIDSFSVGRRAGSTITYHKSAEQANNSVNARTAAALLTDPNYDLIKESLKSNTVTFIYTRDFDTNTEPTVTKKVQVKLKADGDATITRFNSEGDEIIADKSEYVPSDYTGFDVEKQKAREASWKNSGVRYNPVELNNRKYFNKKFGILGITSKPSTEPTEGYPVGRKRGSTISYHVSYVTENNSPLLQAVLDKIGEMPQCDIIEENIATNTVKFIDVIDFDESTEPMVSSEVIVKLNQDGTVTTTKNDFLKGKMIIIPDTINEKRTNTEEKIGETKPTAKKKSTKENNKSDSSEQPVELKARSGQSAAVNKDNPLRGNLYNIVPQRNYGKTDAAIDAINAENRATATSIGSIIKEIGKRFKVNIYAKRYRNRSKNTLGWFDNMHSQIHTQEKEQLGVAIHELGHKIDALTELSKTEAVKNMVDNVPGFKAEFKSRGYSNNEMPFEVVADFVWKYLSEPDKAYEVGRYAGNANFYDTFEKVLKQNKLFKDVQRTRGDVLAFTTKNTTERIRGQVKTRQEAREESKVHINDLKTPYKMLGKLNDGFNSIYGNFQENFIDSTWAASQVVKQAEKASGRKLSPAENLQLALEFSGSNASTTDTLITRGFITPAGEITGREAFADIIKEVEKKGKQYSGVNLNKGNRVIEDFGLYLVARHAIDRENLGQTTMSQDASGGDNIAAYKQLIKDFDKQYHDLFNTHSDRVYEWYDDFMDTWLVKTGMLEQEKYDHMKKMYPHYVPMFRVMDVRNSDRSGSKGVNPLKHNSLKGSTRQIYNPIENIMVQVNNIVSAYHNNQVGKSIHLLWNSNDQKVRESIAMFVSKVDIPLAKQTVQTEQMKASLQDKIFKDIYNNVWSASERGSYSRMTPEQQEELRNALTNKNIMDEVIDDVVTQFIPSDVNLPADTVVTIINSKKHYYNILDKHLAMAIAAAPPSSALLQTIGKLTRVFSALTTSSNPIFAISNAIRDFQHGWVYTDAQKWYQNFTYPAEWAVSLGQAFKNEFFGKQSERYMQFKSTTGFSSKYMADSDTLGRVMTEMRHSHNPLVWISRFIEKLNSAVESAPRYVAFKRVYNATGGNITAAGKAQREATVNFNRRGKVTRQANQAVPFLGAAIAGVNQFVTLVSSKETYTTHEGRMKLARAMVTQALPSILLAFMNTGWFGDDDEKRKEYDQLSEYIKNNYWVFKFGDVWLRVPRDRELSAFFGVTFQNIVLDYIYPDERDETTMKEFISFMVEQFIPTVSPVGWALVQAHNNKTWYGSSIVSTSEEDYLKNPDTYTYITDESTSYVADALATVISKGPEQMREWLGVLATPKGIDYVLDQLTGVVGDVGLPLTTPTESWAGFGSSLVSKYTSNADKSSRYTTEAYDIMDKLTALKKAELITDEEASWLEAFDSTMSTSTKEDPDYVTVGDYYKQIKELKNDVNLSNKERTEKMNEIYTHIADMTYNLVRAYKDGGTVQNYAEKIIPEDISSVGLTAEMYTNAYKTLDTGDDTSTKFAIVADTSLTEEQKQYMSQDILSSDYDNYAVSYKKLADKGVTAEQVGTAKESVAQYSEKKAKAIAIAGSGIENAALIGTVVAGTSDDKIDAMTSYYSSAVSAGVTADMYVSVTDKALGIAQANGKKGITKDSLASASKAAGLTSAQTYAIKHIYNSKWK